MLFYTYPPVDADFNTRRQEDGTKLSDNISFVKSFVIKGESFKRKSIISKCHLFLKDCFRSFFKIIFILAESVFRKESNDKTYIAFIPHGAFGDILREKAIIAEIKKMSPKSIVDVYWKVRVSKPWLQGLKNVRFFLHANALEITKNKYDMIYYILNAGSRELKIFINENKKDKKFTRDICLNLKKYDEQKAYSRMTFISDLKTKAGVDNVSDEKVSINFKRKSLKKFNIYPETKYVTLNYGGRGDKDFRVWDIKNYDLMVSLLKKRTNGVKFIQVGLSQENIKGCDIYAQRRTSLDELLSILSGSMLHIDIDSGCSHMSHALGTKALILFCTPQALSINGYCGNINIASSICNYCDLVFLGCPLNKPKSFCIDAISAEFAAEKALEYLKTVLYR